MEAEELEQRIEMLRTGLMMSPNNPAKRYMLGVALRRAGKLAEAVEAFERAIRNDPKYVDAHHELASAYAEQRRWQESAERYGSVNELAPDRIEAFFARGASHMKAGDRPAAL